MLEDKTVQNSKVQEAVPKLQERDELLLSVYLTCGCALRNQQKDHIKHLRICEKTLERMGKQKS